MMSVPCLLLLVFVTSCSTSSESFAHVWVGKDFSLSLDYDFARNAEGVKRVLDSDGGDDDKWQFYYFCEVKKNKDKCGAWIDKNGQKIKSATNKVTRTKTEAIVHNLSEKDSGRYTRVPEDKDPLTAYLQRVRVGVQAPPPKFPPTH